MTPSDDPFVAPRRRTGAKRTSFDEQNIRDELSRILLRAQSVGSSPRNQFVDGSQSYDTASMVFVRLAALTERPEFGPWMEVLTSREISSIRTTRNIVAHSGYAAMKDDIFWESVTARVPEIIARLLEL